MELIDRYVDKLARALPAAQRDDIAAELRQLLEDEVEGRAEDEDRQPREDDAVDVLRRFGRPRQVAARYAPGTQVLIGPRTFHVFRVVLQVTLALLASLAVLALLFWIPGFRERIPETARDGYLELLGGWAHSLWWNLTLWVAGLALVDRWSTRPWWPKREWDPRKLPPVRDRFRLRPRAVLLHQALLATLLVLFNVFPEFPFGWTYDNGSWQARPMLLATFWSYLPWLNLWWIAAFAINLLALIRERWIRPLRGAKLAVNLYGAAVLLWMVTNALT